MEIGSSANAMAIGMNSLQQAQHDLAQTSHDIASQSAGANATENTQTIEGQPLNQGAQLPPAPAPSAAQAQTPEHQSLTADLIQMKVEQHQAQTAAKVIRTADEALGTLIDIRA